MKRLKSIVLTFATFLTMGIATAQDGVVIYSLPSTTVSLTVEAEKESFIAGPYAKYAAKYMGADARMEDAVTYTLKSITMVPYIEADQSTRIAINLGGRNIPAANFLQMCSQGLIVLSDGYTGKSEAWRFPSIAGNDHFAGKDVEGNLTSATTTLYKTVNTGEGFKKVSVSQSQVVEKSLEKKAQETADAIFNLRRKRVEIITGDTDATFSGEALSAAIAEISRLEQEYLSLFYGISEYSTQKMNFDVTPKADNSRQMYVAFRISDTEGLLPATAVSGRPILLELAVDAMPAVDTKGVSSSKGGEVQYRVPATATAKVVDAGVVMLQTRIPVYQLGKTLTFPLNSVIK
ncbi:MAG: DUF4831 family protein [Bacteroidales bacterium]|nr:DUF4831 family protein [Bacteroidales bacterium]